MILSTFPLTNGFPAWICPRYVEHDDARIQGDDGEVPDSFEYEKRVLISVYLQCGGRDPWIEFRLTPIKHA